MMCLLGGLSSLSLKAQEEVSIGNGTTENYSVPFETYRVQSGSQSYYLSNEIGKTTGGTIDKIAYYISTSGEAGTRKIRVYLRNTDESYFPRTADGKYYRVNMTAEERVFEGTINTNTTGWVTIDINNFSYEGKNLLVAVYDYTNSTLKKDTKFHTYKTNGDGNCRTIRKNSSSANPEQTTSVTFTAEGQTPNIKLIFEDGGGSQTAPDAPTLESPTNGATGIINPTLRFSLSDNTTQYQILLDKNTTPTKVVKDWTTGKGEVSYQTSDLDLEAGTTYYWRVVAKNTAGETESEEIFKFTTLARPDAPTLMSPDNNATGVTVPTLKFSLCNNTAQYQILLDKNTTPTTVVKDWTTDNGEVSYQTSDLEAGATYYWQVVAKNTAGETTSDIFQFTTSNFFPVTDYKITLDGYSITLEWQFADQKANEYQVCFGEDEENLEPWHFPEWQTRKTDAGNLVEDGSFTFEDPSFVSNGKVYFRVNVRKDEGEIVEGKTAFYVIFDEEEPITWSDTDNNANDVFVRTNVNVETDITAKNITIEDGGVLKVYSPNVLSANTLVINEGGQFFATNKTTFFPINTVKFNNKIANPDEWEENNRTGWQFISSPFKDASISSFIPEQDEGDYDLYKYDDSNSQWVNHKDTGLGEKFAQGIGYLASYETKEDVTFTGTINRTNKLMIGQDGMMENPGIYLLGNPFLFNMDWESISTNGAYGINATSFVVVKTDGAYEYKTSGEIKVGEGFFILTTNPWASFDYNFSSADIGTSTDSKSRNAEQSKSINIIASGKAGKDNVIVNFAGKAEGFNKLQNFNDAIATVYVSENGKHYGIANVDENTTEVALNFNAKEMGNYSISLDVNGKFETVTLVDRFTGIETNMLLEDEYTFTATSNDSHNRFVVRLAQGSQLEAQSQFVYQSGEELILSIEGHVQIVDMLGRVVYSNEHSNGDNRISVSEFNNAAYVVRVINEEGVKTQKVVIY